MSYRLSLTLHYKSGEKREVIFGIPEDVGTDIQQKGLIATTVRVEHKLYFPAPALDTLDGFKTN